MDETAPAQPSDQVLVERARAGDTRAFGILFERYQRPIYGMLVRMLRHPDDASDLTQETFVKAFRALKGLRDPSIFFPWLRQIAVNLARTHAKRAGRVYVESLDETTTTEEGEQISRELPDWTNNPERVAEEAEMQAKVRDAVASLSPDHRQVITLHHLEQMPVAEIAAALHISVGTVKSRLSRARDHLHRKLRGYVLPEEETK